MRKLLVTLCCLVVACSVQAQMSKAEQIKDIRQLYAKAKEKIAQNGKTAPDKHLELVLSNKADGAMPPSREVVNFYFEEVREYYEPGMALSGEGVYFMTRKYTCGDIDIYQEWLFDREDLGKPVFAYQCQQQNDGSQLESRYYWGPGGLIEMKSNDRDADAEGFAMLRYAQDFLEVFNKIANRNDSEE